MLRAEPKFRIVGPLRELPAIPTRQQLIYGRRVSTARYGELSRSDSYWPSPLALLPHTSEKMKSALPTLRSDYFVEVLSVISITI